MMSTEVTLVVVRSAEAAFLPNACAFVRYLGSGLPGTCSCHAGQGAR
jgi:hypothetical protein